MKRVKLLFFVLLITASCTINTYDNDHHHSIYGSGELVTQTRSLGHFDTIRHNTAGKIYLTSGGEQKVTVTADDNVIDKIRTSVVNGILTVDTAPGYSFENMSVELNITMGEVAELSANSAGSIIGTNRIHAGQLGIYLSSAGFIDIEVEARQINSNLSSAGNLIIAGTADSHYSNLSSAGNLQGFGLTTNYTDITVSSAGSASISVQETLRARISSIGSVFYRGDPQIYHTISSLGRLVHVN